MTTSRLLRISFSSLTFGLFFLIGYSPAFAATASVSIQSVSPAGAISPGTSASFVASASNFSDPTYAFTDAFTGSGKTAGTIDKVGYFTWTPTAQDAGMHVITVTVTDLRGDSASASVNLLVASNSIVITEVSPGVVVAEHRTLTFSASAPGFTNPTYAVYDANASGSSINSTEINSSGSFTWTPTSDDLGPHTLSVRATDIYGHSAQAIENITVINPLVSIQSLKPSTAVGVGTTISFSAASPTLTSPVYTVHDTFSGTSSVGTGNITSAGAFSWTPVKGDIGSHLLTLTGTDTVGNAASTSVSISVTAAPLGALPLPATTVTPPAATGAPSSSTLGTTTLPPVSPPTQTPASSTIIPTSTTASGTAKYTFTTLLSVGSRGTAVTELQKRLTALGFFNGAATGYFGAVTAASVKAYQGAHGLSRVGYVGPGTRAALNAN